ncbi:helix-turn-helix transcriptional regulator [Alteromonas sp. V450]|uniref:helix-turn-helix domain-containing protein n=1 Tax=Alteromonas sp. V450 TaxID=1912139 RepID=UPI0008FF1525|nr:LuxR C-terminal-related transcriptional regulator [Alteromonas sp. V450]OJF69525.1 helix-turn-helix transcriptional regulator [Alteromonas sp. V450]
MTTHEIRENTSLMTAQERERIGTLGITPSLEAVPITCLSKRELQVVYKIMEGSSNKVIANELFISERTVKFHCANIYKKLNVDSRSALIAGCFRTLYQDLL